MTPFWSSVASVMLAQAAEGTTGSGLGGFMDSAGGILPLVLMFGVVYLLLIRPASKQRKQHAEMLNQLKKDDEVVTSGGMYGRIINLEDKVVTLEIADKVKIRILRDRIAGKWNPESTPASR